MAGKYVCGSHHDREVIVGNRRDVKDYIAGVSTRIHEASTVPDHDCMGWRVSGESPCTLRNVKWGVDTADIYPYEALRGEVVMVERVRSNLQGGEDVGGLVYARCCGDADCQWVDERQAFGGCRYHHSVGHPSETADNEYMRKIASRGQREEKGTLEIFNTNRPCYEG